MWKSFNRPSSMAMVGSSRTTRPGVNQTKHQNVVTINKRIQNWYLQPLVFSDWPMSTSSCERCLSFRCVDITNMSSLRKKSFKRHQRWSISFEMSKKRLLPTLNKRLELTSNFIANPIKQIEEANFNLPSYFLSWPQQGIASFGANLEIGILSQKLSIKTTGVPLKNRLNFRHISNTYLTWGCNIP